MRHPTLIAVAALALVPLTACSENVEVNGINTRTDNGTDLLTVSLSGCWPDGDYTIEVTETDSEIRFDVIGNRDSDLDCAFFDEVPLEAPLGERTVVLPDASDGPQRWGHCEPPDPGGSLCPR